MPYIFDEYTTMQMMIRGLSISRFGDGELKLACGGDCVSQVRNPKLAHELQSILIDRESTCLIGIPRIMQNMPAKQKQFWTKIQNNQRYNDLYTDAIKYASSFITRADNSPWIDTPEYWKMVPELWRDKDITLVIGPDGRSLVPEDFQYLAKSVHTIVGPRRDAYEKIDEIETEIIAAKNKTVIMALGATATCLAHRLNERDFHALDLGHIGRFMKQQGQYYRDAFPN